MSGRERARREHSGSRIIPFIVLRISSGTDRERYELKTLTFYRRPQISHWMSIPIALGSAQQSYIQKRIQILIVVTFVIFFPGLFGPRLPANKTGVFTHLCANISIRQTKLWHIHHNSTYGKGISVFD